MRCTPLSSFVRITLTTVALALVSPVSAQIVNVQAKFSDAPEEGFSGVAEASIDWRSGNTSYLIFKSGLTGIYARKAHLLLLMAKGEYGVASGDTIVSRTFEHLRYRMRITDTIATEAFVQHEFDEFRRLKLRAIGGAGLRFDALDTETVGAALGVAVMVEYELLLDSDAIAIDPRASTYLLGRLRLAERVVLTETLYYQPKLTGFSDLRLLNQTAIVVEATEHFSISFGVNLSWDTAPPSGVEPLDTQLKTALALRF